MNVSIYYCQFYFNRRITDVWIKMKSGDWDNTYIFFFLKTWCFLLLPFCTFMLEAMAKSKIKSPKEQPCYALRIRMRIGESDWRESLLHFYYQTFRMDNIILDFICARRAPIFQLYYWLPKYSFEFSFTLRKLIENFLCFANRRKF